MGTQQSLGSRWVAAGLMITAAVFFCHMEKAAGQVLYGNIVGNVQDVTRAAIPGAAVTVVHQVTNWTRETITSDVGSFNIGNAPVGLYTLRVSLPGFRQFVRTDIQVNAGAVTRSDVTLLIGEIEDSITVAATTVVLQTDKADVSVRMDSQEITQLPLSNYRNYQSLINLVPGATPANFQNTIADTPGRSLTTNISGTNRNSNNTRLDGAVNTHIWLPHHTAYVAATETIDTVNITTNTFDAEQGMAGGAAVTVITKSGTNDFRGSIFAFHDNSRFRARNFFFVGDRLPKHIRNITGFTVGGPLKRDKLFFFAGWEGTFERVNSSGRYTVPTADQRAGDFQAFGRTIYDPMTGNPDGTGRTPFPDNKIPEDRISLIALKMQALIPLPNLPGTSSNLFRSGTQEMDRNNVDIKIDWLRSEGHTIWGKFSTMFADVQCQSALDDAGGPGLGCSGADAISNNQVYVATIGHNWSISPSFLIDGTFGVTDTNLDLELQGFGENFGLDVLGIPGTNGPDPRQSGKPIFNISGYTALGNPNAWAPVFWNDRSYSATTNFTRVQGSHQFRFGMDLVRHELNHWQPELGGGPRGRLVFSGGATALLGGPAPNQFNAYANFLLGLPTSMAKSLQYEEMTGREWQLAWYFQDRWNLNPNLTLSLGLRYEFYPLMTRVDRGLEVLDFDTLQVYLGGVGDVPKRPYDVSKKLFAPRLGLVYRLGEETVIRSGYGITYNPIPFSRPLRGFYPLTIAQDWVGPNPFTPFQSLNEGIPLFDGPDLSSGVVDLPPTAAMRAVGGDRINRGYIQSWNLILERKLPQNFVGSVGYVGTRQVRQLAELNLNAAGAGEGLAGQRYFPEFGRTASTTYWNGWLGSSYHSLQSTLNRQFTDGFFVKGAYTWSKAINQTDDDGWAGVMWNHPTVLHRNRALAGYDITHNFQMAVIADLPFGKGMDHALGKVLRGWQINAIFGRYSGRPFTVGASGAALNAPGNSQTADQVKATVEKLGGIGPGTPYYDPTAFASVLGPRFGNSGRNILRSPRISNLDFSLFRSFDLTEYLRVQFRAEAFNLTNTPAFGNPTTGVESGNFMRIVSALDTSRQIRFGLRFDF